MQAESAGNTVQKNVQSASTFDPLSVIIGKAEQRRQSGGSAAEQYIFFI